MKDNIFKGIYGGFEISFLNGSDTYKAETITGIRGFGVRVLVIVENGEWSAVYEDTERPISIKKVYKLICDQSGT